MSIPTISKQQFNQLIMLDTVVRQLQADPGAARVVDRLISEFMARNPDMPMPSKYTTMKLVVH